MNRPILDITTAPSCPPVVDQIAALSDFLHHHRRTASRAELMQLAVLLDGLSCRLHAMATTARSAARSRP